jgi:vancomycin resistance protein YoaR
MDSALGPRTLDNGYMEAKIILKNKYVDSPGGGICQITTTLYDAVLKAGLKIIQRTPHSMPSVYCEPGQDATIAEGLIDFKFKNDSGYAVCLSTYLEGNHVTIRVLGKKPLNKYIIKLKSEIFDEYPPTGVEYVIDDSVPDGQLVLTREAKNGCRAILYRETYDSSGKLIKRERISEDSYKPVQQQYKVNSITYDKVSTATAS